MIPDKRSSIMIEKLKEAGLKATIQRRVILEAMQRIKNLHPSVFQIHAEAQKKLPRLSLSTTYATISELHQLGLIKILAFEGRESRCEINPKEHIHLICERCGTIIDYRMPVFIDTEFIYNTLGFRIEVSRLEYRGVCKDCLSQMEAPTQKNPAG